jgi:hypothetical protein
LDAIRSGVAAHFAVEYRMGDGSIHVTEPCKTRMSEERPTRAAVGCDRPAAGYVNLCPLAVELRLGHVARIAKARQVKKGRTEHRRDEHAI